MQSKQTDDYWNDPQFVANLPQLPLEYKASRAQYHGSFWIDLFNGAIVLTILWGSVIWILDRIGIVPRSAPPVVSDIMGFLVPLAYLGSAFVVNHLKRAHHENIRNHTSTRVTEEGIEYYGPGTQCTVRWEEIDRAELDSDVVDEDDYPAVIKIRSGGKKFELSARFFTDEEINAIAKVVKRNCKAAQDNEYFRAR